MKHYLLDNDGIHHENRLKLEAWYARRERKTVPFNRILHELMAEKVASICRKKP